MAKTAHYERPDRALTIAFSIPLSVLVGVGLAILTLSHMSAVSDSDRSVQEFVQAGQSPCHLDKLSFKPATLVWGVCEGSR